MGETRDLQGISELDRIHLNIMRECIGGDVSQEDANNSQSMNTGRI
jgi:hypothetical protein